MTTGNRVFFLFYALLICIGLLGFIAPPSGFASEKGEQREAQEETGDEDDERSDGDEEEAGDEDDERSDRGGKERLEHCLRALSRGKKLPKHCPPGGSSSGIAKGDFNGDGFGDLAVGVPDEDTPATRPDAGAVIVIYGSSTGLTTTTSGIPASRFWSQGSTGIPGTSETGDGFGSALAAGDFNDDGFSDLAVGVPDDVVVIAGAGSVGRVVVIYGSANGLTTDPSAGVPAAQSFELPELDGSGQLTFFAAISEEEIPPNADKFGSSLAWGDFNGDGVGDLAVGAPRALVKPSPEVLAGAVGVLFGSRSGGLSTADSQVWTQNTGGIQNSAEGGDRFGAALTAGDFDGDGETDLAIGVPGETELAGLFDAFRGAVAILYGDEDAGLTSNNEFLTLDLFISPFGSSPFDTVDVGMGAVLAAGDFDADGRADLAIGAPFADRDGAVNTGMIFVQSGTAQGLFEGDTQFFDQNIIFGAGNETGDRFGSALAAGDFDADGRADLAIGAPFEDVGTIADAGAVFVVYGSLFGLSTSGRAPQSWHQNTAGIEDDAETADLFGYSLTAWNFGRNQLVPGLPPRLIVTADLAIGAPFENVGSVVNAGAVNVIYGSAGGLTATNDQFWSQNTTGVPGGTEAFDHFGLALY